MDAPCNPCASTPAWPKEHVLRPEVAAKGTSSSGRRAKALSLAGPATPSGRLWFLSRACRLNVCRHWFFQAFEPWERRPRARSTLGLTHAAEHKSCGVLKSHPAAHNLTSQELGRFWPSRRFLPSWLGVLSFVRPTRSVERKTNDTTAQGNNRSRHRNLFVPHAPAQLDAISRTIGCSARGIDTYSLSEEAEMPVISGFGRWIAKPRCAGDELRQLFEPWLYLLDGRLDLSPD